MGLRWALVVFGLRFGVEFGHFGSVLRDGMIAVVGFAGGVLWLWELTLSLEMIRMNPQGSHWRIKLPLIDM